MISDLFDFRAPITEILRQFAAGESGGFLPLAFGPGQPRSTQFPIANLSDDLNGRLEGLFEMVGNGEVDIVRNQSEILDW